MEEGDKDLPAKRPFQTVVNGAGPLSRSELDMLDKKHVLSACFTDGNPRSELSHCGSLSLSISLILLTKPNTSLPVQFCFHEEANGASSSRNSLTCVLMF